MRGRIVGTRSKPLQGATTVLHSSLRDARKNAIYAAVFTRVSGSCRPLVRHRTRGRQGLPFTLRARHKLHWLPSSMNPSQPISPLQRFLLSPPNTEKSPPQPSTLSQRFVYCTEAVLAHMSQEQYYSLSHVCDRTILLMYSGTLENKHDNVTSWPRLIQVFG